MEKVISKESIYFLSPEMIGTLIFQLETQLPGWWWSISQEKSSITVTRGPGKNSPYRADRELLDTEEGDRGFRDVLLPFNHDLENQIPSWINLVGAPLIFDRRKYPEDKFDTSYVFRHQNDGDLGSLRDSYLSFLNEVHLIEGEGYLLEELYLGSCDLSVDCSIRGKRPNGQKFDVSVDFKGDACLADSLSASVSELKADILTTKWKMNHDY